MISTVELGVFRFNIEDIETVENEISSAAYYVALASGTAPTTVYWIEEEQIYGLRQEWEEEELTEYIPFSEMEDRTEELLNEVHDTVSICGYEYDAGRTLRQLDPIAFNEEVSSYADSLTNDGYLVEGVNI